MSSQETKQIDDCWKRRGVWSKSANRCLDLNKYGHCRNCPIYSQAGRFLLDRPLTDEYRQELITLFQKSAPEKEGKSKSAFVFMAGGDWLALHSELIVEVVNIGPIHSIPHKNSRIFRGIVNIKGRLQLCISIGGVLRNNKRYRKVRGVPTAERLIVASKDEQIVVFPVTEVLGSFRYKPSMLKPLPVTVSGAKAVYTNGILSIKGKDVGFLDDTLLFKILTRNLS
jgi:chemotaxis-related protein WspD